MTTATATLLGDLTPGEESSEFSSFTSASESLFFELNDSELWRTDGTQEGTRKLADVNFNDRILELDESRTLFEVDDASSGETGTSIWITDGTPGGTHQLIPNRSLKPFDASNVQEARFSHGVFYFSLFAETSTSKSWELYRTDGTASGTEEIPNASGSFAATSQAVFYKKTVPRPGFGWIETIYQIRDANSAPEPVQFAAQSDLASGETFVRVPPLRINDDYVLFATRTPRTADPTTPLSVDLWVTDGTVAGTFLAATVSDSQSYDWTWVGDSLVVAFGDAVWTDGTEAGTSTTELRGDSITNQVYIGTVGNRVFFLGFVNPLNDVWATIMSTNGSTSQFESRGYCCNLDHRYMVLFSRESASGIADLLIFQEDGIYDVAENFPDVPKLGGITTAEVVGDSWYIQGPLYSREFDPNPERVDLWVNTRDGRAVRIDLGSATTPSHGVLQPTSTGSRPSNRVPSQSSLSKKPLEAPLFVRRGNELVAFDGGLVPERIAPINALGNRHYADDLFYFVNTTEELGREVWISDGTKAGTTQVDINPDSESSSPRLIYWNGQTFATAVTSETGRELYILDAEKSDLDGMVEERTIVPGDLDDDGRVGFSDFLIFSASFGKSNASREAGDFNGDMVVDFADFLLLSHNYDL